MKKVKIAFALSITLAISFMLLSNAVAATRNCSADCGTTCSASSVQAVVNAASDGDIILVPAGTCNWGNKFVGWVDKNITVMGAGIDSTVITVGYIAFDITNPNKSAFRVSGFTFNGTGGYGGYIRVTNSLQKSTYGWRVDHCKFDRTTSDSSMLVYGVNWGLIDNCSFQNSLSGTYEIMHINTMATTNRDLSTYNYWGGYSWSLPINWGTANALYVEDNIFNAPNVSGAGHPFDANNGTRIVFRHNTVIGGGPLLHPTKGNALGNVQYEIYNNTFATGSYVGFFPFTVQGGGTGVIFNNQWGWNSTWNKLNLQERRISTNESGAPLGKCSTDNPYDGYVGASRTNPDGTGWPCYTQVGRGPGNVSMPVYAWNNGTESGCATGGLCTNTVNLVATGTNINNYIKSTPHSNGEVDFVNNGTTAKPGYTPYIYPHPLAKPLSPLNLRIIN